PPEVIAECDFTGSTAAMADYVGVERPSRVVLLTECSMSDNVALQYPDLDFVRPCNLCPHMKRITLKNIRHALETMTHEVTIAPEIAERARPPTPPAPPPPPPPPPATPSSACWRSAERLRPARRPLRSLLGRTFFF